jgi:hypothetical protein
VLKLGDGFGNYGDASDGTDAEYNSFSTFACGTPRPTTGRRNVVPENRR